MSEKNSSKENSTKAEKKEQGFNLVETVMEDLNKIDKTQQTNSHKQINPENNTNNKPKDSISVNALHEMKKKIDKHDYNAIKELLDSQNISQQSKNQLLNFSFNQLHSTNNANQRKIINSKMLFENIMLFKIKCFYKRKARSTRRFFFFLRASFRVGGLSQCL